MQHVHALARSFVAGLALAALAPVAASAQPRPTPTPIPVAVPTPVPLSSSQPSGALPYPAFGTPAPGVAAQRPVGNAPQTVSLQDAVDIAASQSPLFAQERAAYRAIQAQYGSALGALYPNISGSGSIDRSFGGGSSNSGSGGNGGANASGGAAMVTTESGRVSINQLIFDGGRVIAGLRAAQQRDIAGREDLDRNLQTLVFNVAQAYYAVLQAQAGIAADTTLVRQFQQQEAVVQAQIRAGAAARSDLAAAQFQTAQARNALVAQQGVLIAAQSTFATTLGLDADAMVNPQAATAPVAPHTLSYQDALAQALQLRPDYLATAHDVQAARDQLRYAKLGRFPTITANASDGAARNLISSPPVDSHWVNSRSIGASINLPIYDQGLTNYNIATAAAALDEAIAGQRIQQLTVESDVRSALANLVSTQASLTQAQAEVQSANVNLQATQARYRVGAATITDVITAEANLATASRDQVAAVFNEQIAEQRYYYAVGTNDLRLPSYKP